MRLEKKAEGRKNFPSSAKNNFGINKEVILEMSHAIYLLGDCVALEVKSISVLTLGSMV